MFIIIKPSTYFVGGFIASTLSPGETIIEPAVAALLISVVGGLMDSFRSEDVGLFGVIISSIFALIFALIGSYLAFKGKNS